MKNLPVRCSLIDQDSCLGGTGRKCRLTDWPCEWQSHRFELVVQTRMLRQLSSRGEKSFALSAIYRDAAPNIHLKYERLCTFLEVPCVSDE